MKTAKQRLYKPEDIIGNVDYFVIYINFNIWRGYAGRKKGRYDIC